jgi:transcriptional regulator with GAF, ATPase, and Fis domain
VEPSDESIVPSLASFARALVNRPDVTDVLYGLADHVVSVLALDGAGVSLADSDGRLQSVASLNSLATTMGEAEERLQEGPSVTAYQERRETAAGEIRELARAWPQWGDRAASAGVEAVLAVPVQVEESPLGALSLYSLRSRAWTPDDLVVARLYTDIAASYVAHRDELDGMQRLTEHLQVALDSRVIIEQAKGVVAHDLGCGVDQAFEVLRTHARRTGTSLRSIAHAVVHQGLRPATELPGPD